MLKPQEFDVLNSFQNPSIPETKVIQVVPIKGNPGSRMILKSDGQRWLTVTTQITQGVYDVRKSVLRTNAAKFDPDRLPPFPKVPSQPTLLINMGRLYWEKVILPALQVAKNNDGGRYRPSIYFGVDKGKVEIMGFDNVMLYRNVIPVKISEKVADAFCLDMVPLIPTISKILQTNPNLSGGSIGIYKEQAKILLVLQLGRYIIYSEAYSKDEFPNVFGHLEEGGTCTKLSMAGMRQSLQYLNQFLVKRDTNGVYISEKGIELHGEGMPLAKVVVQDAKAEIKYRDITPALFVMGVGGESKALASFAYERLMRVTDILGDRFLCYSNKEKHLGIFTPIQSKW